MDPSYAWTVILSQYLDFNTILKLRSGCRLFANYYNQDLLWNKLQSTIRDKSFPPDHRFLPNDDWIDPHEIDSSDDSDQSSGSDSSDDSDDYYYDPAPNTYCIKSLTYPLSYLLYCYNRGWYSISLDSEPVKATDYKSLMLSFPFQLKRILWFDVINEDYYLWGQLNDLRYLVFSTWHSFTGYSVYGQMSLHLATSFEISVLFGFDDYIRKKVIAHLLYQTPIKKFKKY